MMVVVMVVVVVMVATSIHGGLSFCLAPVHTFLFKS